LIVFVVCPHAHLGTEERTAVEATKKGEIEAGRKREGSLGVCEKGYRNRPIPDGTFCSRGRGVGWGGMGETAKGKERKIALAREPPDTVLPSFHKGFYPRDRACKKGGGKYKKREGPREKRRLKGERSWSAARTSKTYTPPLHYIGVRGHFFPLFRGGGQYRGQEKKKRRRGNDKERAVVVKN